MGNRQRLFRFIQRIPTRWRLVLVSLGLLTLLLSALGIIISLVAEQNLMNNEINVLQSEAQVAAKGVMKDIHQTQDHPFAIGDTFYQPASSPPGTAFQDIATALLRALVSPGAGTNAILLKNDGSVLLANPPTAFVAPIMHIQPRQVQQIIQTTSPYLLTRDSQGQRQLVVFIPLVKSYHTIGILQISTPTAPIDNFLATFRLTLFLGIVGTLLLAMVLTFPLVGVALSPLIEIERTSRRIAQGELSMRIEQPLTDDEIGRLARSFNRMVARLEAAFQRQKRFVGDVSHELRTPLTALSGSLEMLLIGADQGNPEVTRRLARGMFAEVQRMHRMVEDLLALTRLDEGKLMLRKDELQIEIVLSIVYEQAAHLARGQKLSCFAEPNLPAVSADSDRLQQVLLNLLDNALKFTPSEGRVTLRAERTAQNMVAITVSDTGQGIPAEALPHVFDRFYRADPARSRLPQHEGGSGLGLAIAKELIEAQGGSIAINSVQGHGTQVTLCLPALPPSNRVRRLERKADTQKNAIVRELSTPEETEKRARL